MRQVWHYCNICYSSLRGFYILVFDIERCATPISRSRYTEIKMARIITVSSRKGGVGKSTLTTQIAVYLHKKGKRVCIVDCDPGQGTVSRYLENRIEQGLPSPYCTSEGEDIVRKVKELTEYYETIIIDTPGGHSKLAEDAHRVSDTILTVFNDSFVDLDVLVRVQKDNFMPRAYSEHVWGERKLRMQQQSQPQNWVLVLNRVGQMTRNRKHVTDIVEKVTKQWGITFGGLCKERVGYRDGFLSGRTPVDPQPGGLTASHVAARQEIRHLVSLL